MVSIIVNNGNHDIKAKISGIGTVSVSADIQIKRYRGRIGREELWNGASLEPGPGEKKEEKKLQFRCLFNGLIITCGLIDSFVLCIDRAQYWSLQPEGNHLNTVKSGWQGSVPC